MSDVRIWPENHWREVWHDAPCRGPMKRHADTITIEDGSTLRRYVCVACGAETYAGVNSRREIVSRRGAA